MEKRSELRQLYLEFKDGDRVKLDDLNKENTKAQLLKYINSEIERISELHINIIAHNPQMKDYRIEQISDYNDLIRVEQILKGEFGRKKTKLKPDLKLSDVLAEGQTVDKIKKLYKNPDNNSKYLGMFLRVLRLKGYIKRDITAKEIEIIGKEFKSDYKDHRSYTPPENLKTSMFKHIPDL